MRILNDEEIQIERYKVEKDLYKHTDYVVTEWDRVVVKAQYQRDMRDFIEWMDGICREHEHIHLQPRRRCGICVESLKQLAE